MNGFSLKNMLIGTASAATQIEGGELEHSWIDWYRKGRVKDGSTPARANDHYRLWREDAELMHSLGMQIYRFGVEWARIEPREGEFDDAAIAHYVEEARTLRELGIRVLVTLHHFTNPMWFERLGAFEKRANIPYFIRFVEKLVTAFGDVVDEYITINEPNVYATQGYLAGIWPPGKRSIFKTLKVMSVMAAAHIEAYAKIHELRGVDVKVSFANHVRAFMPKNPKNLIHRICASLGHRGFQGSLSRAMMTGEFRFPISNLSRARRGKYCDFIGINYYSRSIVTGLRDAVPRGAPVNDLGWEIYPQGIADCARELHDIAPLPIYITENGTCDNKDAFRARYVYEHIKTLCNSGLPVERYYHWCFCDNFEWAEGESARFGIVHVDYGTQTRTVKTSGRFLSDMIASGGVDEAIYDKYIAGIAYNTNA